MKRYILYIKSHNAFPDYEDEVVCQTKEDAVEYFYTKLRGEYDREFLRKELVEEDEINK
jgi:hypothetical protein